MNYRDEKGCVAWIARMENTFMTTACFSYFALTPDRRTSLYIFRLVIIATALSLRFHRGFWSILRCSGCFPVYLLAATIGFVFFGVEVFAQSRLVALREELSCFHRL